MNKTLLTFLRKSFVIGISIFSLSHTGWGDISNIANSTYKDALNNSYNAASNTVAITVVAAPSLSLVKSATPMSVLAGGEVTFSIQYTNSGGNATNVLITDMVPAGSTLVAGSITSPAGVTSSMSGNTISWTVGNLDAGASGTVSFKATAN